MAVGGRNKQSPTEGPVPVSTYHLQVRHVSAMWAC